MNFTLSNLSTVFVKRGLVLLVAAGFSIHVYAENTGTLGVIDGDGWHRWSVDAVANAPSQCCYTWNNRVVQSAACHLDDDKITYGSSTGDANKAATEIQVFARLDNGAVKEVRSFDKTCRVNTKGRVVNHGRVETSDSLSFLAVLLDGKHRLASQSLAAISVHDSNQAQMLLEESSSTSKPVKLRKDAIFWMGQVRARQSSILLKQLMLSDEVDEVREHTVFSVSQSNLTERVALIDQVARNDRVGKVRGQAWFWMAQMDVNSSEQRILSGIEAETSRSVQEQAVFALSQLEDGRGPNALIRVIETPDFSRSVRKKALFWLAQSDSERAVDYLANVLDR